MARAAMFVQHSVTDPDGRIEGFPVAIAEAMSRRCRWSRPGTAASPSTCGTASPASSSRRATSPAWPRPWRGCSPTRRRRAGDGPGRPGLGARASVAAGRLRAAARAHGAAGAGARRRAAGPEPMARPAAVTLFVLAYRQEAFVRAAIEGAFAQTYAAARDRPVGRRQPRRHLRGDAGDGGRPIPGRTGWCSTATREEPRADRARQPGDGARDRRLRGAERRRRRLAPGAGGAARRRLAGRRRPGDGGALAACAGSARTAPPRPTRRRGRRWPG